MSEQSNEETRPDQGAAPYGTPPPAYGQPNQPTQPTEQPTQPTGQPGQPTQQYPEQYQQQYAGQAYPQQYQQPYPGQPYPGQPGGWQGYPEQSQGVLALVLGIIGVFVIQLVAPFAWVIGAREVRAVDEGRRDPRNRGLGLAGMIMGIIGTVILAIGLIVIIIAVIVIIAAGTSALNS
jgi:hypothetical protein